MKYQFNKLSRKIALSDHRLDLLRQSIEHELKNTRQELKDRAFQRKFMEEIKVYLSGINENLLEECAENIYLYYQHHQLSAISYLDIFTILRLLSRNEASSYRSLYHWLVQMCEFDGTYDQLLEVIRRSNDLNIDWIDASEFEDLDPIKESKIADVVFESNKDINKPDFKRLALWVQWMIALFVIIIVLILVSLIVANYTPPINEASIYHMEDPLQVESPYDLSIESLAKSTKRLPKDFLFTSLNFDVTREYLTTKNSMLLDGDYLSDLNTIAKLNNINPYLLLSIIGQEQNFVNRDSKHAEEIIHNPYNLYGSWEDYKGDFKSNTQIACNTIHDAFKDYQNGNPYIHLNNLYAEDENWHLGVMYFFEVFQPESIKKES